MDSTLAPMPWSSGAVGTSANLRVDIGGEEAALLVAESVIWSMMEECEGCLRGANRSLAEDGA